MKINKINHIVYSVKNKVLIKLQLIIKFYVMIVILYSYSKQMNNFKDDFLIIFINSSLKFI